MDDKSKAAVHAIHAAILIEYGDDLDCFKNACEYAQKACILDPETSHWFHIYSLVLIAQRQFIHTLKYTIDKSFLLTSKLDPAENEIRLTIQKAVTYSGIKSTCYVNSFALTTLNQFFAHEFQVESDKIPALKKDIVRLYYILLMFISVQKSCVWVKCTNYKIIRYVTRIFKIVLIRDSVYFKITQYYCFLVVVFNQLYVVLYNY